MFQQTLNDLWNFPTMRIWNFETLKLCNFENGNFGNMKMKLVNLQSLKLWVWFMFIRGNPPPLNMPTKGWAGAEVGIGMLRGGGDPLIKNENKVPYNWNYTIFQLFLSSLNRSYQVSTAWFLIDIDPVSPNIHFMLFARYWSHIQNVQFMISGRYQNVREFLKGILRICRSTSAPQS